MVFLIICDLACVQSHVSKAAKKDKAFRKGAGVF